MNRIVSFAVLPLALVYVSIQGCKTSGNQGSTSNAAPQRLAPVEVKVAQRDIVGFKLLQASLYMPPEDMATVTASYSAPVERVAVKPGQYVRRGQLLVQLAAPDVQSNLQTAKETLQAAQAAYSDAVAKYGQTVRQDNEQLKQAQDAERQARQQAQTGGDATALQPAEDARKQAEEALIQARADEKTNLLPYKQQLDQATAALTAAHSSAHQSVIAAPISGAVLLLNVQPGQQVGTTANQPIGTIADLDALQIKADLTDDQLTTIQVGTTVEIVFRDVQGQIFHGRVSKIRAAPAANGTTLHEATIEFKNADHLVKPGAIIDRVGVRIGEAKGVLAAPVSAIHKDPSGRLFLNKLVNGQWVPTFVTVGLSDGQYTEIKSGIGEGDTVQAMGTGGPGS